jgi:Acetamidase/Formamidase family
MLYPCRLPCPGALLSIGDGHAAQGDGEVAGTAIECGIPHRAMSGGQVSVTPVGCLRVPRIACRESWASLGQCIAVKGLPVDLVSTGPTTEPILTCRFAYVNCRALPVRQSHEDEPGSALEPWDVTSRVERVWRDQDDLVDSLISDPPVERRRPPAALWAAKLRQSTTIEYQSALTDATPARPLATGQRRLRRADQHDLSKGGSEDQRRPRDAERRLFARQVQTSASHDA